jgi:hypothetical protein
VTLAYGNSVRGDALNNLTIGTPSGRRGGIRDRSDHTGSLTAIVLYVKTDTPGGYSGGTGGSWTVRCESDDGSGLPSGNLISAGATVTAATPITQNVAQTFTFGTPIADTFGTLRHFVLQNADGAPLTNFVSVNSLYNEPATFPLNPVMADIDRAFVKQLSAPPWVTDTDRYPIFATIYADGYVGGQCYLDALFGSGARDINATSSVRLNFTPTRTVVVDAANFSVCRQTATSAALVMNLKDLTGGGTVIATQSFAAATVNLGNGGTGPFGHKYVRATFAPLILMSGNNYALSLDSTEATAAYRTFPLQQGGGTVFAAPLNALNRFVNGYWEYTTNSGGAWNLQSASTDYQPMAYFESATRRTRALMGVGG